MFGIGIGEIILIAFVAFMVVGPKGLPEMAKSFGKWFVKFRRMTFDVRSGVDHFIRQAENELRDDELSALRKEIASTGEEIKSLAHSASKEVNQISHDIHHDIGQGVNHQLNQELKQEIESVQNMIQQDPNHQALSSSPIGPLPDSESEGSLRAKRSEDSPENPRVTSDRDNLTKTNAVAFAEENKKPNAFEIPLEIPSEIHGQKKV